MRIITKNKFAYSDYDIETTYDAGIILQWHEVKSIKTGQVDIKDAIVRVMGTEIVITNMNIPLYHKTPAKLAPNYDPKATRTLLLNKKEITKIVWKTHKTGLSLIPLMVFETKTKFIKIQIGLWKLLKKIEKKQILKEKDIDRQMKKEIKNFGR